MLRWLGKVTFPFFIALLGPIRSLIFDKIFTKEELNVLDSKGDVEEEVAKGSTVPAAMEKAVVRSASFRGDDKIIDPSTGRAFTKGEVQRITSFHSTDEAKKALNNILHDKREAENPNAKKEEENPGLRNIIRL